MIVQKCQNTVFPYFVKERWDRINCLCQFCPVNKRCQIRAQLIGNWDASVSNCLLVRLNVEYCWRGGVKMLVYLERLFPASPLKCTGTNEKRKRWQKSIWFVMIFEWQNETERSICQTGLTNSSLPNPSSFFTVKLYTPVTNFIKLWNVGKARRFLYPSTNVAVKYCTRPSVSTLQASKPAGMTRTLFE